MIQGCPNNYQIKFRSGGKNTIYILCHATVYIVDFKNFSCDFYLLINWIYTITFSIIFIFKHLQRSAHTATDVQYFHALKKMLFTIICDFIPALYLAFKEGFDMFLFLS